MLAGDGGRLVRRQEPHDAGDVFAHQLALQALEFHQLGVTFRIQPQLALGLGQDPAGCYGVDANIVGAEVPGERSREPRTADLQAV